MEGMCRVHVSTIRLYLLALLFLRLSGVCQSRLGFAWAICIQAARSILGLILIQWHQSFPGNRVIIIIHFDGVRAGSCWPMWSTCSLRRRRRRRRFGRRRRRAERVEEPDSEAAQQQNSKTAGESRDADEKERAICADRPSLNGMRAATKSARAPF